MSLAATGIAHTDSTAHTERGRQARKKLSEAHGQLIVEQKRTAAERARHDQTKEELKHADRVLLPKTGDDQAGEAGGGGASCCHRQFTLLTFKGT